jgi:hypothetical protein
MQAPQSNRLEKPVGARRPAKGNAEPTRGVPINNREEQRTMVRQRVSGGQRFDAKIRDEGLTRQRLYLTGVQ